MMLGSEDISTNELRMQDDKSVATRRTSRVGGDVVVGEGRDGYWGAFCEVLTACELPLTNRWRFLQECVNRDALFETGELLGVVVVSEC